MKCVSGCSVMIDFRLQQYIEWKVGKVIPIKGKIWFSGDTVLLKNEFNPKAVSNLMGHAKEIITIDVYGDNKVMAVDCTREIDMFINELHLKQIEMPMAEDRFFDSVCVNPEDL